jgi:hypothetical protein
MMPIRGRGRGRGKPGRKSSRRNKVRAVSRGVPMLRRQGFTYRNSNKNSNRRKHVIPPSSFTRSSIGKELETITIKNNYVVGQIEVYDEVMSAWSSKNNTSKNCVTRVYVNKSAMAADLSQLTPQAATAKRTITHVSGVRVQGHSTKVSTILASGKKIYNANSTTQRNVKVEQVESRHEVGDYHTTELNLPSKADMVNQKGFKLIKQTITGLGTLEFDYGHVADFMTSVSSHDLTTGNVCSIDFSANIHSVPNPDYTADTDEPNRYVSPPDFIFIRSNDPSLVLQGFNDSSEETNILTRAQKELEIFSLIENRYLARTDLANLLPVPKLNNMYRLPQPLRLSKSNNIIAALTIAVYFNNPLDPTSTPFLYLFENMSDYDKNFNKGTVSRALINIPTGTYMAPRPQIAPYYAQVTDEKGKEFKPGARYMVVDLSKSREEVSEPPDSEDESDSEISIITESLSSVKVTPDVKKKKEKDKENRTRVYSHLVREPFN